MFCMYIYNTHILIQNWLLHEVFWRTHFNIHGLSCLYSYHSISPVLLVMSPVPSCFPTFFLPSVTVSHFISLPCFLGSLSCSLPHLQWKARQGKERKDSCQLPWLCHLVHPSLLAEKVLMVCKHCSVTGKTLMLLAVF